MAKPERLAALIVAVLTGLHTGAPHASAQPPNVVIQWNQILQTLFGNPPGPQLRALPMMHIAMFDAINSIEEVYTPYRVPVQASQGASAEAAAATAARDVLAALYPAQQATFDSALAAQLAGSRLGSPGKAWQWVGRPRWRFSNGVRATAGRPPSPRIPPTSCRRFQDCGSRHRQRTVPRHSRSQVVPFALLTSTQFLPPAPPTLTSARYAADFNEVKLLGSVASAARTPEQTLMAQVFAGVNTTIGFFHVWNIVAGDVAQSQGLSLIDTARLSCSSTSVSTTACRPRSRANSCTDYGGRSRRFSGQMRT